MVARETWNLSRNYHSVELSVSDKRRYICIWGKLTILVTLTYLFGLSTLSENSLPLLSPVLSTDISVQLSGADDKFLYTGPI